MDAEAEVRESKHLLGVASQTNKQKEVLCSSYKEMTLLYLYLQGMGSH